MKKAVIIGAGPAGITAAYQLAKANVPVHVFESSDHVGGMASTIPLWGQKVDFGPHRFFTHDRRVLDVYHEVIDPDYSMVNRLTRIYYRKKLFYYPLRAFDALSKLGVGEAALCILSYLKGKFFPEKVDETTLEGWVSRRFGRRLFNIFFKTYSEKLWGLPCTEIDADFAAQRIKKFSLLEAVWNALSITKGNKHATLVERFAYPHEGTGALYQRMAHYVQGHGGEVLLGKPVKKVLLQDRRVAGVEFEDGTKQETDLVLSTMPLTLMLERLPETPADVRAAAASLQFRNTILVYLHVQTKNLFPDNWLYIHAPDLKMGRVTNFRNWVPQLTQGKDSTILAVEYWCSFEDALWKESDANLVELAKEEMKKTGLIKDAPVTEGAVRRVPRCYPVYRRGYKDHLKKIAAYVNTIEGLIPLGRYGSFRYNNQDHSILMGILAAENVLGKARHNLWAVNTEEEYQES